MVVSIIAWLKENHDRLLTFVGIILVGILAFEAGLMKGEMRQVKPLLVSIPADSSSVAEKEVPSSDKISLDGAAPEVEPVVAVISGNKSCPLVGSKNSDKYHLATCAVVKRIKPENKVCFSSKEDAEKRGYAAGCLK